MTCAQLIPNESTTLCPLLGSLADGYKSALEWTAINSVLMTCLLSFNLYLKFDPQTDPMMLIADTYRLFAMAFIKYGYVELNYKWI